MFTVFGTLLSFINHCLQQINAVYGCHVLKLCKSNYFRNDMKVLKITGKSSFLSHNHVYVCFYLNVFIQTGFKSASQQWLFYLPVMIHISKHVTKSFWYNTTLSRKSLKAVQVTQVSPQASFMVNNSVQNSSAHVHLLKTGLS